MAQNPLEVIGIHPAMLRNLDTEEAMSRVKAVYRGLMREVHPDKAQSPEVQARFTKEASRLSTAFDELTTSGETFESFRREYIRISPVEREIMEATKTLSDYKSRMAKVFDSFGGYIQTIGGGGLQDTVFNCAPCRLHLNDAFAEYQYHNSAGESGLRHNHQSQGDPHARLRQHEQSWKSSLELGEHGEVVRVRDGKRLSYGDERVMVGTLKMEIDGLLDKLQSGKSSIEKQHYLESKMASSQKPLVISAREFARKLIPWLSSELTTNSLLISCVRPKNGELYYEVEGSVESIDRLD